MGRYPKVSDTPDKFNRRGEKVCRNCDNVVSTNRKHYCSEECMDEFNRNNSWFWVRKDVLRRDKWICQMCEKKFKKKDLDVDHTLPVSKGGNLFDKSNLRTLCRECHKLKTKLERNI
jgi:5-methylcytosine-specific restriction protein A